MKVGIVCPYSFDEPGGVQAHIIDLGHKLMSLGHQVQVIGPCSEGTEVPDFVVKGGGSIPIPYNGSVARLSYSPKTFRQVRDFIRDGKFDVLHIHEPNSPSFSMAALRVAQGPIVATYHASSSGSKLLKVALPFLRSSLEKVRGGIAVSEMARRWQVEQLGGDPVLIPNGVETRQFVQAASRRDLDGSLNPVKLVFLGRIEEPRKGLDILLKALDHVGVRVELTVIGGGEPKPHPHVEYVGRVSDEEKARILGEADIYVAPNTGGESFGIVLVEAMAAGCAVIATDLEAFAAVCDADSDHPAGMLFENGNSKALAAAITAVATDPQLRRNLVEAGTQRAQLYDWDRVADEILRVYDTVANHTTVEVE